ncbi:MAG: DegV family protein, partial [Anaerolineae bacterium]|nr:DegV family protein [Anaerolineae bacterium]
MSLRIIIDDAADAPQDLVDELQIHVVPINVTFGAEQYYTGLTIDRSGFYEKVRHVTGADFPKTSQPTPYQFEQAYRTVLADGADELIAVTVSEKLSGTYASAIAAAEALAGRAKIHVFDSQSGSAAQGLMAVVAARLARQGQPAAGILEALGEMRRNASIYLLIDSLEFAVRGGRVSSLQSGVASLFHIKPVMTVEDGLIVPSGRVRTMGKALERIVEKTCEAVGDRPVLLASVHANTVAAGTRLLDMARP